MFIRKRIEMDGSLLKTAANLLFTESCPDLYPQAWLDMFPLLKIGTANPSLLRSLSGSGFKRDLHAPETRSPRHFLFLSTAEWQLNIRATAGRLRRRSAVNSCRYSKGGKRAGNGPGQARKNHLQPDERRFCSGRRRPAADHQIFCARYRPFSHARLAYRYQHEPAAGAGTGAPRQLQLS